MFFLHPWPCQRWKPLGGFSLFNCFSCRYRGSTGGRWLPLQIEGFCIVIHDLTYRYMGSTGGRWLLLQIEGFSLVVHDLTYRYRGSTGGRWLLLQIEGFCLVVVHDLTYRCMGTTVFEIKGALGARRAHFRGRAHVFRTFFTQLSPNYHSYMSEECIEKFPGAQFKNECTRGAPKIKG